jgi:ABC-type dipeptide/oligopeptide/nickel transport system ATPase subunit
MITEEMTSKLSESLKTGQLSMTPKELSVVLPFLFAVNLKYKTSIYQEEIHKFNDKTLLNKWVKEIIQGIVKKDIKSIETLFRLIAEPVQASTPKITSKSLGRALLEAVNLEMAYLKRTIN